MSQTDTLAPRCRRTHGALLETTTTIWADILQHIIHAGMAERAFIAAHHRLNRGWWQVAVATLAIWF